VTRKYSISDLHAALASKWSNRQRLDEVSSRLLGTPYCSDPLGGSPGETDPPAFSLHCFDCVTYVETAVALALSHTPDEYVQHLTMLRYRGGSLFWADRLHYFSLWLESNEEKGVLEILVPEENVIREQKRLETVPGLPIMHTVIEAHPWDAIVIDAQASIIGFVSRRSELDVFHVGILADEGRLLRHASESAGMVIEEPLNQFVARENGSGLLLARLKEPEKR
jgi:hypothetical protein